MKSRDGSTNREAEGGRYAHHQTDVVCVCRCRPTPQLPPRCAAGVAVSDADAALPAALAVAGVPVGLRRQAGRRAAPAPRPTLYFIPSPRPPMRSPPTPTNLPSHTVRRVISATRLRDLPGVKGDSPQLRCGSNRGSEMKCDDLPSSRGKHSQVASEVGLGHRTAPPGQKPLPYVGL